MSAITQTDIDLALSHNKYVQVRTTLYDDSYQTVTNLSGVATNVSYSIDSKSEMRRSCTLTLHVPDKSNMQTDFEKTWNKRMVKIEFGIFDDSSDTYKWYNMGMMLMKSISSTYTATEQNIKMSLVDLMASATSARGSQIGHSILIPAGSNVRSQLAAIVSGYFVYKQYSIPTFSDTIPYDITSSIGDYPYDVVKKILDLFPYYESFYNESGVFTVQEIPTKISDPVDISHTVIDELLISENKDADFSSIRNTTELWGKELDAEYTATSCTAENSKYTLFISDDFETLVHGETFAFKPSTDCLANQTIQIQDTTECGIYTSSGSGVYTPITAGAIKGGTMYVVRYVSGVGTSLSATASQGLTVNVNQEKWLTSSLASATGTYTFTYTVVSGAGNWYYSGNAVLLATYGITVTGTPSSGNTVVVTYSAPYGVFDLQGELAIHVIVQEITQEPSAAAKTAYKNENNCDNVEWLINPSSPYACTIGLSTGLIQGEMKQVLEGGEYDTIYTTELAYERASYENWTKDRLNDSISIEMIMLPCMEVNSKIEYTSPVSNTVGVYLVESISYDVKKWTMTVSASKFYPYYPFVTE